jgi:hypothetical protein
MEAALAALKGPKSGLTAEAWLEAGLVEATAAYMGGGLAGAGVDAAWCLPRSGLHM